MSDPIIRPEWIARAFDVPLWVVGLGDPPPPRKLTGRERPAAWIGQTGWDIGRLLIRAARWADEHAPAAANRITDAGDWLAEQVSGRRP